MFHFFLQSRILLLRKGRRKCDAAEFVDELCQLRMSSGAVEDLENSYYSMFMLME